MRTPASKIPVPKRGHLQAKGGTNSQTANPKSSKLNKVPQTDEENRMDFLRSKLENSMTAFIKARKQLEEVLSAGGSGEDGRPPPEAAAELKTEIQRHRALTSKVEPLLNRSPLKPRQDNIVPANSYEFFKSIVG